MVDYKIEKKKEKHMCESVGHLCRVQIESVISVGDLELIYRRHR